MKRLDEVFISYSQRDDDVARAIYTALEANGVHCWYAAHSVGLSDDFNEDIMRGIKRTRLMVVVVSEEAQRSDYVKNEVQQAINLKKAILPFCLTPALSGFMSLHLGRRQCLNAAQGTLDGHINTLVTVVQERLRRR